MVPALKRMASPVFPPSGSARSQIPVACQVGSITREASVSSDVDEHQVGLGAALGRVEERQLGSVGRHGGGTFRTRVGREAPDVATGSRHGVDVLRLVLVVFVVLLLIAGEEQGSTSGSPRDATDVESHFCQLLRLPPFSVHHKQLCLVSDQVVGTQVQGPITLVADARNDTAVESLRVQSARDGVRRDPAFSFVAVFGVHILGAPRERDPLTVQ